MNGTSYEWIVDRIEPLLCGCTQGTSAAEVRAPGCLIHTRRRFEVFELGLWHRLLYRFGIASAPVYSQEQLRIYTGDAGACSYAKGRRFKAIYSTLFQEKPPANSSPDLPCQKSDLVNVTACRISKGIPIRLSNFSLAGDFSKSAQARFYLSADLIYEGKLTGAKKREWDPRNHSERSGEDTFITVVPSGKTYRGNPGSEEKNLVVRDPDKFEIGKSYVFVLIGQRLAVPLSISGSPEMRRTLDYVFSDPSADDAEIYEKFLEFRKMRAREQRASCRSLSEEYQAGCLKAADAIENM